MVTLKPDSTYLVLIRHASTDWNTGNRFQGHADTPLSEAGRNTIGPCIEALRPWAPAVGYTSDLQRAREMAEAAGKVLRIPVIATDGLRECSYGEWEGLTLEAVREKYPDELEQWRRSEAFHARGGGESLADMQARTWDRLQTIAAEHEGERVAVFTHSGPVRGAVCRIFDLGIDQRYRFQVDNSSLTVLRRSPRGYWQLVLLNQTSHLDPAPGSAGPVASRPYD